jgi:hypothetical protein
MSAVDRILTERNRFGAGSVLCFVGALLGGYLLTRDEVFSEAWYLNAIMVLCGTVAFIQSGFRAIHADKKLLEFTSPRRASSVENRLDELERLKRRDIVTAEEYAAKWQEILKRL